MDYYTDCSIFGDNVSGDSLKLFNSLFGKEIFKLNNKKIEFIFPNGFYNIKKDQVSSIEKLCKEKSLLCLFSWSSEGMGWGYVLYSHSSGRYEFKCPMESGIEKTEADFLKFCEVDKGFVSLFEKEVIDV